MRALRPVAAFPALHAVLVGAALYAVGMSWGANSFRTFSLLIALIYLTSAFGLDVIFGLAGIISIGHAASFGIGAYTTAILTIDHHWSLLETMGVALAIGAVAGAVMGLPAGRIGSLGLGIITLGYVLIFVDLVNVFPGLTGGAAGKIGVVGPLLPGGEPMTPRDLLLTAIVVAGATYVIHWYLRGSHFGRTAIAVKENAIAAAGLGVNAWLYQVAAFAIGSAIGALAGTLFAYAQGVVDEHSFGLNLSIQFLLIVIIGGAATRIGPVIGAALLGLLPYFLSSHPDIRQYIYGAALIAVVLVLPRGIVRRTGVRVSRRAAPELAAPAPAGGRLLELDSVHRHFAGVVAVDDMSLTIDRGEVVAVIGPNGSGKTTLLNVVCGIYRPQRGRVSLLDGGPHSRLRDVANRGVARTFQVPRLFPSLTVREHLLLAESYARGRRPGPAVGAAVDELLQAVGLDRRPHAEVRELGPGQLRFLEIAVGLLRAPALLLLDEPTSGLSASEMEVLAGVLDGARDDGLGIVAVEHHLDWVRRVATRVIVLHNGTVLWDGDPAGFADSELVRSAYLGTSTERTATS